MLTISINSPKGDLQLNWQNKEQIRFYDFNQSARYVRQIGSDLEKAENLCYETLVRLMTEKIQNQFNIIINSESIHQLGSLRSPRILNIGSGASTLDMALSKYYESAHFYLVDKEEYTIQNNSLLFTDNNHTEKTVFQHSWTPFEDGVGSSSMPRDKFTLLEPSDSWPDELDLIFSFASWGWHYNYPSYIERLSSLKCGGVLILTVLLLPDNVERFIDDISDKLQSSPIIKYYQLSPTERSKLQYGNTPQKGGIFIWKKSC